MREFLKGLELDKETIDSIMAEHGKLITEAKEENLSLKQKINTYEQEKKTYDEKLKSYDDNLKNLQTMTNENNDLKAQLQMSDSNVKKEFLKFVTSEVSSKVDENTDFGTALENYKKENPQYFGETVVKKVQSSPNLSNGGNQSNSTNDIMNDILRGARN